MGAPRKLKGTLRLDPLLAPGDYILQVTVRDLLALPSAPRTVVQFTDFEVGQ